MKIETKIDNLIKDPGGESEEGSIKSEYIDLLKKEIKNRREARNGNK